MLKATTKLILLPFILLFFTPAVKAQIEYLPFSSHQFSVGAGLAFTALYGDITGGGVIPRPAVSLVLNYNVSPDFSVGLEGQYGIFQTGTTSFFGESNGVHATNKFKSANANFRVSLGSIIGHTGVGLNRIFQGFFIGSGIGVIKSNIIKFKKRNILTKMDFTDVRLHQLEFYIPVNMGFVIELPRIGQKINDVSIFATYQHSFVLGDYIDGYNLPTSSGIFTTDRYGFISFGLMYYFGKLR